MTAVETRMSEAACLGLCGLFDAASDGDAEAIAAARDICSACPIRSSCLEGALERREPYGVWGGLSRRERDVLLADRDAATFMQEPPPIERHGRSCATSGRCDCAEGKRAHAAYVKQWRAQGPSHTRAESEPSPFEQLGLEIP